MSQNIYKSEKKKEKGETRKDKRGNERGESNEVNLHDFEHASNVGDSSLLVR